MSTNILKSYAKKTILLGAPSMDLCNFYCFMWSESRVSWHFMCFRGHIQVKHNKTVEISGDTASKLLIGSYSNLSVEKVYFQIF